MKNQSRAGRPIIAVSLFALSVLPTVLTVHNSNDNHLDLVKMQNNSDGDDANHYHKDRDYKNNDDGQW